MQLQKSLRALLPLALLAASSSAQLPVTGLPPGVQKHFNAGNIYVTDDLNNKVYVIDHNNWNVFLVLDSTDGFTRPTGIVFSEHGDALVADFTTSTVFEIEENAAGTDLVATPVLTTADGLSGPYGGNSLAIGDDGSVYVGNFISQEILKFNEDYTGGTIFADASSGIDRPDAMAFLADGDMLVANRNTVDILRIDPAGLVSIWDSVPPIGQTPVSIAIQKVTSDVYVRTSMGNIYRYPGGVPSARVLLGTYGAGFGAGSVAFDIDHKFLITVSELAGQIYLIQPVTGQAATPISMAWNPAVVTVVGNQYPPGATYSFGDGLAGAGGIIPNLHSDGGARIGQTITLESHDFVGAAPTVLFMSLGMDETILFGGEVHIDFTTPWVFQPFVAPGVPGAPGEGDLDIPFPIPNDPSLVYTNLYLQHGAVDLAALQGVSLSNCLTLYIGA